MENNEKKEEYFYRVYLNGPKEMFGNNNSQLKVCVPVQKTRTELRGKRTLFRVIGYEVEVPYMGEEDKYVTVYCRSIDGKMMDVITDMEYTFAAAEDSDTFKHITYSKKEEVKKIEIFDYLKDIDRELVKNYVTKIRELNMYVQKNYINPDEKNKLRIERERRYAEEQRKNDEQMSEFIANFHKDYDDNISGPRKK